jgi:hypothetical protein
MVFELLRQRGRIEYFLAYYIGHITNFFTECLTDGYIPLAWRAVRVIFVPKPGRDSYELAKSFSLTSFFLKTMERLVDSYIRAGPLRSFPFMQSQYAYQKGRSTEAALRGLVQKIEGSFKRSLLWACFWI